METVAAKAAETAVLTSRKRRQISRRLRPLAALLPAIFTFSLAFSPARGAPTPAGGTAPNDSLICEREMTRAAAKYGVPLGVLYAVALTETGRRGSLHPYALNIEGPSYFPQTLQEALAKFEQARKSGAKLIDIGCMQINHHFHGSHFASVVDMFNPRENVDYAAQFLKDLRVKEGSWTLAAARYHAGPGNNSAQKQYVCAVMANMVASGFGKWTPSARAFCH